MSYNAILDTEILPDDPVTSLIAFRLRDNPIAAFNGEDGAPRLQDAALSLTVTPAGSAWVQARMAGSTAGGVGGLAFAAIISSGGAANFGDTVAGSAIGASNGDGAPVGSPFTGTWRCLGRIDSLASGGGRATLFIRIA